MGHANSDRRRAGEPTSRRTPNANAVLCRRGRWDGCAPSWPLAGRRTWRPSWRTSSAREPADMAPQCSSRGRPGSVSRRCSAPSPRRRRRPASRSSTRRRASSIVPGPSDRCSMRSDSILRRVPGSPGAAVAAQRLAELHELFDEQRSATRVSPMQLVPAERAHLIERIAGMVETWSLANPVLLALDDLHWADPATLATLGRLHRLTSSQSRARRRLPAGPAQSRAPRPRRCDGERRGRPVRARTPRRRSCPHSRDRRRRSRTGSRTAPERGARRQSVPRRRARPRPRPRRAHRRQRRCRRARHCRVHGEGCDSGDPRSDPRPHGRPRAESTYLLQVGAALGRPFSVSDVASMLGRPVAALLPLISTVVSAGLLEEDGHALRFRHQLGARGDRVDDRPAGAGRGWTSISW